MQRKMKVFKNKDDVKGLVIYKDPLNNSPP